MTDIIYFVIGLVIGVPVGMFLMSLCVISYDSYKEDLNILEDNADIVQIDVEKEFNQMVEDYNQSPKNTSINPLEIETVDEPIKVTKC